MAVSGGVGVSGGTVGSVRSVSRTEISTPGWRLRKAAASRDARESDRQLTLIRDAAEYGAGHIEGFRHYAGGQLVQEIDMSAPVRGARIVLTDDKNVRAEMTATQRTD